MALLNRDAILAANDLPTRDVPVPEWGGTIRIRSMTAKDRGDYELMVHQTREAGGFVPDNFRSIYAASCIVDEKGNPVFTADDIEALGNKSASALSKVYDAITEMNKIEPGAIEDAAKN